MTGGLRARHSGESALSCKLHTVRCTTSSYYCEMQCKAPSFCRREKREWLGFNLSRVRQREGHNLPYTHTLCKMFNKFAQIQFAQRSQYVAGTPPLPKWSLCKLKQQQFVYIAHSSVHVVRCAMHTLAFSVHLRWWSLNSSKRPRFVSHSLVKEKLQPT